MKKQKGFKVHKKICQVNQINSDNNCQVQIHQLHLADIVKGKRVCIRCFLNDCKSWKVGKIKNDKPNWFYQ
jgi:hypothetical protein